MRSLRSLDAPYVAPFMAALGHIFRELMTQPPNNYKNIGLTLAVIHLSAYVVSFFLAQQGQGWGWVFILPFWLLVDFPVSILHVLFWKTPLGPVIDAIRENNSVLDYLLYSPTLVHGVLGTVWWGYVPKIYIHFRAVRKSA